jgi:uncharacterized integral membrane protein
MPWKTILIILLASVFVLFIALNIDNTTKISFIFFTVDAVPIYLTVFISMLLGALFMVPVMLKRRRNGNETKDSDKEVKSKKRGKGKGSSDKEIEESFNRAVQGSTAADPFSDLSRMSKKRSRKKKNIINSPENVSDIDVFS